MILEARAGSIEATQPADEFSVIAQAGVQTNATPTWVIDYGYGTAPATLAIPPVSCQPPHNQLVMNTGIAPHLYATPGTYTVRASIGLTGCDGSPGPVARPRRSATSGVGIRRRRSRPRCLQRRGPGPRCLTAGVPGDPLRDGLDAAHRE